MTVKELITKLNELPPDAEVYKVNNTSAKREYISIKEVAECRYIDDDVYIIIS